MTTDFIQGADDGTGKKVATDSIVEGGSTVHRQRVLIDAPAAVTGPLTDAQLRAAAVPISGSVSVSNLGSGGLTDTQLRAAAVPVTVGGTVTVANPTAAGLTDTQLRAAAVPVTVGGTVTVANPTAAGLTDTQLRAAAVPVSGTFFQGTQPVSGPITDTQLRASAVPVSAAALPLPAGASTETTLAALNTKTPAVGQAVSASSRPVVIASDQSAVPISNASTTSTGSITTQNLVPAGAATAGSAIEVTLSGANSLSVQVTGTYTGALSLQATIDGTNWVTLGGIALLNVATGGYLASITSALAGIFQSDVGGFLKARITGLAVMTGTAVVSLRATSGAPSMLALDAALPTGGNVIGAVTGSGTFTTQLPTAAALADSAANPTAPAVGAQDMSYNGATWDRLRNNFNTTTGDTGAKTVSVAGATQTNFNAAGAHILLNIGTVSGTTPTLTAQLQISPDGGTTWVNVPGAVTASITATGTYLLSVYPGIVAAANASVSYPLSRTWRLNYTIGGTTPSFTITNVQVAYMN